MAERRPQKVWKLNYHKVDAEFAAQFTLYADPAEARMAASESSFISVRDDGISLSPGFGNSINIQGMSQNLKYGGMIQDLPFPMSLLPVTIATPFPNQIISPPLMRQLPTIRSILVAASSLTGI